MCFRDRANGVRIALVCRDALIVGHAHAAHLFSSHRRDTHRAQRLVETRNRIRIRWVRALNQVAHCLDGLATDAYAVECLCLAWVAPVVDADSCAVCVLDFAPILAELA